MVYGEGQFGTRAKHLYETYNRGVQVIFAVLSTAFVASQFQRILSLPHQITNYLYLALLVATIALVGAWILYSKSDLDAVCEWLDPKNYQPPNETIAIVGIGVILALLLLSARDPIAFGSVFTLYGASNLAAGYHVRREIKSALKASRDRLDEDKAKPELAPAVAIYEKALNALEIFEVFRPNLTRIAVVFILAALGLTLSIYARWTRSAIAEITAYIIYVFAIAVPDLLVMVAWRLSFYNELRPLSAARYELMRAKTADSNTEIW